jgi:hypothetical protein
MYRVAPTIVTSGLTVDGQVGQRVGRQPLHLLVGAASQRHQQLQPTVLYDLYLPRRLHGFVRQLFGHLRCSEQRIIIIAICFCYFQATINTKEMHSVHKPK